LVLATAGHSLAGHESSTTQDAQASNTTSSTSAAKANHLSRSTLKWRTPQGESQPAAVAEQTAATALEATSDLAKESAPRQESKTPAVAKKAAPIKSRVSVVTTKSSETVKKPIATESAEQAPAELAPVDAKPIKAARPRSRVERLSDAGPSPHSSETANSRGSSLKIVTTSHDEPRIDPFAEDELPALHTAQKPETKRAIQAGMQDRSALEDPFGDKAPRLERVPSVAPPERAPPEELTQAPSSLPYQCPTPKEYVKRLSDISTNIAAEPGEFPVECGLGNEQFSPRSFEGTLFAWKASALCHKPLYFEDVELERYGQTCSPLFQPLLSAAKFYLTLPILPYKMGLEPPCECIYPLGYYRPGSCAPFIIPPVPISLRGALLEAGVWVAGVALVP